MERIEQALQLIAQEAQERVLLRDDRDFNASIYAAMMDLALRIVEIMVAREKNNG